MISVFANALHDKTYTEAFETCEKAGWHSEEFDCDRDDNTVDCDWDDNVEVTKSSSVGISSTISPLPPRATFTKEDFFLAAVLASTALMSGPLEFLLRASLPP